MSMVQKFRLVDRPMSRPAKTNMSIREIPVMMSGFTMGIFVTVFMAAFIYLLRSLLMPTAAAVPITVEMRAAHTASTRGFFKAPRVLVSWKSSLYQYREKPENTDRLLPLLKENTSRMMIGAKRKRKIRAVYSLAMGFMAYTPPSM